MAQDRPRYTKTVLRFILVAWCSQGLKEASAQNASAPSAVLVTNTKEVPNGYSLTTSLFRGTGYWSERQPMLFYRSDHAVATYNGSLYILGGLGRTVANTVIMLDSVFRYDPVYHEMQQLAPMPEPSARFGWAVVGDKLYVFGGLRTTLDPMVGSMLIYDFTKNSWSRPSSKMVVPRSDFCAGVIGGKIYAAGGFNLTYQTLDTIERFDPATGEWSLIPKRLKEARGDCGCAVTGNQLYLLGGTMNYQPSGVDCGVEWYKCYRYSAAVERFNPTTGSVDSVASMRRARGDFGVVESSPGRILVAGGEYNDTSLGVYRLIAQPWVEEYDVANDYWTPKAPLPTAQFRFVMAKAAGQVYAVGGQPSCPSRDQTSERACVAKGLSTVLGFVDEEQYPNLYVATKD